MSTIYIVGSAVTKFGELWDKSLRDLIQDAAFSAIKDATLEPKDIEAIFIGNMAANQFEGQSHLGALVSSFFPHFPPSMRIESACASGSLAMLTAENALLAQRYNTVLVIGAEKMTDVDASVTTDILAGAADVEKEQRSTFPGLYALLAQAHMQKFKTTSEQLANVAVKNHHNALANPHAQFHKEITVQDVIQSPMVAEPLHLLDCSPISDGASAVVLSTKKHHSNIIIAGTGHAQDTLALADRKSLTEFASTQKAATQAYAQANISAADIEAAEMHDCFTIAEIFAVEDLGFCKKGKGGQYIQQTQTRQELNPSGGLKACGHPVGATGVKQIAYLHQQMKLGRWNVTLAHNIGGSGATAVVHILKQGKNL